MFSGTLLGVLDLFSAEISRDLDLCVGRPPYITAFNHFAN